MDRLSHTERSQLMAKVHGKHTKPELAVRKTAHALGYRFRLHHKDLPGRPDLVFPGRRAVVFVHGCFWHRHEGCRMASTPKSNEAFWQAKFARNVERDRAAVGELEAAGWRVLTIWECEKRDREGLAARLREFLEASGQP